MRRFTSGLSKCSRITENFLRGCFELVLLTRRTKWFSRSGGVGVLSELYLADGDKAGKCVNAVGRYDVSKSDDFCDDPMNGFGRDPEKSMLEVG